MTQSAKSTPTTNRISQWSDAKLDRELCFAIAAQDDNHPENIAWLDAIRAEALKRTP